MAYKSAQGQKSRSVADYMTRFLALLCDAVGRESESTAVDQEYRDRLSGRNGKGTWGSAGNSGDLTSMNHACISALISSTLAQVLWLKRFL